MKLYHPDGMYVWDSWCLNCDGEVHVFYLQLKRPDSDRNLPAEASLGHALSRDLRNWTECSPALLPGKAGEYDDGSIFTGCARMHDGQIYLYYSSNHHDGERTISGICLATSQDKINFKKHPENPIIEPPSDFYISKETPIPSFKYHNWPDVDCRDIAIIPDPVQPGWLGYVVMRMKDRDQMNSCCVVLCKSSDLINWEVVGPCCTTERYLCFEVPDVFTLDGKWYMLGLTGNAYGQRARWSDPAITHGTIVFVSDSPYGPFEEIKDNLILASNNFQGYSARTVEINGKRIMLYTRPENDMGPNASNFGVLSWPVEILPDNHGGLTTKFWKDNEKAFKDQKIASDVLVKSHKKWSLVNVPELGTQPNDFIFSCKINLDGKAVGISFNRSEASKNNYYNSGMLLLFDSEQSELQLLLLPKFQIKQNRKVTIEKGEFDLKLVLVGDFLEVYLNETLYLNSFIPAESKSQIMLFSENGDSYFSNIELLYNELII